MSSGDKEGMADSEPILETDRGLISTVFDPESRFRTVTSMLVKAGFYLIGGLSLLVTIAAIINGSYVIAVFWLCAGLVALPIVRGMLSNFGITTNNWIALTTVVSLLFAMVRYSDGMYGPLLLYLAAAAASWPVVRSGISAVGLSRRRLGPWEGATAVITMHLLALIGTPEENGRRAFNNAETVFLIQEDFVTIGYLLFLVGTVVGALAFGRIVGQGVGLVAWRRLHDVREHWSESQFWNETADQVRVWSTMTAWLALVLGYFWFYDIARILFVGLIVTVGTSILIIAANKSSHSFEFKTSLSYRDNREFIFFLLMVCVICGYFYWMFIESFLYGLPESIRREIITEVAVFAMLSLDLLPAVFLFVFFSMVMIILAPKVETFKNWVADQITVIQSEKDKKTVADMNAALEEELDRSLGRFFIATLVPALFAGGIVGNWLGGVIFVGVLLEVYFIILSLWIFTKYDQYDFSQVAIKKYLYRDFARSFVNLGILIVFFSVIAISIDQICTWYAQSVVPNLFVVFSPETERLLSTQPLTPAGYQETVSVYLEARAYILAYFPDAIALLIVALCIVLFTPLSVGALYFLKIRSLLSLAGMYLGFTTLNIALNNLLAGELIPGDPIHLGQVGILSFLPAIISNLWVEITAVFKDLWGRIDCPGCDELIKADSTVCRFCGTPLTECSSCEEITRSDLNVCLYCDATLQEE